MAHWLAVLVTPFMANLSTASERPAPPATPVRAVTDTLHDVPVTDPYRWLENAKDPEVEQWQEAQNAFTQTTLAAWPGRAALAESYKSLFAINTALWAETAGKRIFLTKKDGLSNQPVLELRSGTGATPGTLALDPNGFSADGTTALDWEYPSPDGSLLAYGKSEGGSEHSTLYVRDVTTGKDLGEAIPNTQHCALAWDPDGKGFTYSRHPAEGEVPKGEEVFHEQIFHHRLGADPKQDPMVWSGEGAPMQEVRQATSSSDHEWVFLTTSTDWDLGIAVESIHMWSIGHFVRIGAYGLQSGNAEAIVQNAKQSQVFGTAHAAFEDVSGFCSRNPGVCEKGRSAFEVFVHDVVAPAVQLV
jgi:prolyl oligopeptidase